MLLNTFGMTYFCLLENNCTFVENYQRDLEYMKKITSAILLAFICNFMNAQEIKNTIEWVEIQAGAFTKGSPYTEKDRASNENQSIDSVKAFAMSKYEITFEQYDAFCEATGRKKPNDNGWGREKRPVINVKYIDAKEFAKWAGGRLPSLEEWEYACRAGSVTAFNTGDSLAIQQANFNNNLDSRMNKTVPVGSYAPNAWGLYDMHGNVAEWCCQNYNFNWEGAKQVVETTCFYKGGSWGGPVSNCRSAYKTYMGNTSNSNGVGFRIVKLEVK